MLADRLESPEQRSAQEEGERDEEDEPVTSPPASELRAYVGDYYAPELDATYVITMEGNALAVAVGNDLDGVLEFQDDDRFTRGGLVFRFQRDGDRVTGLRLDAGRVKNLWFEKRSQ